MAHARQQIRDAVVTALSALSTTGENVYDGRERPIAKDVNAALRVYLRDEDSETITIDGDTSGLQVRTGKVVVEATAKGTGCEDTADTICSEVEVALLASIPSVLKSIELKKTETDVDGSGEELVAVAMMEFDAEYHTREGVPDTIV